MAQIKLQYLPKKKPISINHTAARGADYKNVTIHMHGHEELLFIKGKSLCERANNGTRFQVQAPALLLNHAGTYHELLSVEYDTYKSDVLFFQYEFIKDVLLKFEDTKKLFEGDCVLVPLTQAEAKVVEQYYDLIEKESTNLYVMEGLLIALLNKMCHMKQSDNAKCFVSHNNYVFDIIKEITQSPEENYSLEQWAFKYNISRSKLKSDFLTVTGSTPKSFSFEVKLHKAASLLRDKNSNVSEVAFLCGFSSVSHFISSFRKFFGITPKHYQSEQQRLKSEK